MMHTDVVQITSNRNGELCSTYPLDIVNLVSQREPSSIPMTSDGKRGHMATPAYDDNGEHRSAHDDDMLPAWVTSTNGDAPDHRRRHDTSTSTSSNNNFSSHLNLNESNEKSVHREDDDNADDDDNDDDHDDDDDDEPIFGMDDSLSGQ
jgi:hypothetical protein